MRPRTQTEAQIKVHPLRKLIWWQILCSIFLLGSAVLLCVNFGISVGRVSTQSLWFNEALNPSIAETAAWYDASSHSVDCDAFFSSLCTTSGAAEGVLAASSLEGLATSLDAYVSTVAARAVRKMEPRLASCRVDADADGHLDPKMRPFLATQGTPGYGRLDPLAYKRVVLEYTASSGGALTLWTACPAPTVSLVSRATVSTLQLYPTTVEDVEAVARSQTPWWEATVNCSDVDSLCAAAGISDTLVLIEGVGMKKCAALFARTSYNVVLCKPLPSSSPSSLLLPVFGLVTESSEHRQRESPSAYSQMYSGIAVQFVMACVALAPTLIALLMLWVVHCVQRRQRGELERAGVESANADIVDAELLDLEPNREVEAPYGTSDYYKRRAPETSSEPIADDATSQSYTNVVAKMLEPAADTPVVPSASAHDDQDMVIDNGDGEEHDRQTQQRKGIPIADASSTIDTQVRLRELHFMRNKQVSCLSIVVIVCIVFMVVGAFVSILSLVQWRRSMVSGWVTLGSSDSSLATVFIDTTVLKPYYIVQGISIGLAVCSIIFAIVAVAYRLL